MPKERQVSFAGGELSPSLWGRTDLDRYPIGARTLRNFIVTPHGVAANRPGTLNVAKVSGSANAYSTRTTRGVGVSVSDAGGALLLFSATNLVVYAPNEATGILDFKGRCDTPYAESKIFELNFSQLGNVVTITHSDYETQELRLSATLVPTLTALSFDVPDFTNKIGAVYDPVIDHRFNFFEDDDGTHPERPWVWAVTRILRDSNGRLYETEKFTVVQYQNADNSLAGAPDVIKLYPDEPQQILFYATKGDGMQNGDILVANRLYRGREGYFGFVGETQADRFVDDGATPDFSNPPPAEFNPFKIYDGAGNLVRTEHPVCSAFFEGRRHLGGTAQRPATDWASATEDYSNFDEVIPPDDADALSFTLATERLEIIRALVPKRQLYAMTSGGEWVISGAGQGEVLTPGSIAAHRIGSHGCAASPAPLSIDEAIFFVQACGSTPRALSVDSERGTIQAADISLMASHLFEGYTIVGWAYAEIPHSILWVARSDGKLLSCTYVREQSMLAWTEHDIGDSGLVESVATVRGATRDIVCLIVNRAGQRHLEVMASRIVLDVRKGVFLDRAVSYNGLNTATGSPATVTDAFGSGGVIGGDVQLTLTDAGNLGGAAVGKVIQFDDPAGASPPLQLQVISHVGAGVYHATVLNVPVPASLFGYATDVFYYCAQSVTELGHIEGKSATCLVDGNVVTGKTVSAGSVTFDDYFAIAHVGIGYNSDLESLDAIQERNRQKIIKKVWLELEGARGGSIGVSLDGTLTDVMTRQVSDSYLAMGLKRQEVDMLVPSNYATTGRVAFRQSQPLPVTILGITRDIDYGG